MILEDLSVSFLSKGLTDVAAYIAEHNISYHYTIDQSQTKFKALSNAANNVEILNKIIIIENKELEAEDIESLIEENLPDKDISKEQLDNHNNNNSSNGNYNSNQNNPIQKSKFAYTTLISGIDLTYKYRGFLYNAMIMKIALDSYGSTADFIAMIGYSEKNIEPFQSDIELLKSHGIIIHVLPRLLDEVHPLGFAEMALLKITPYSFIEYDRIQFFDGDVMPTKNMDCFFNLKVNTFTVGAVSPLNSGWFLAIPDLSAYDYMKEKAIWRLGRDWDTVNGWAEKMPDTLMYRGGQKRCEKWLFNGADMDQGLFTHYYIINHGNAMLIDTETTKVRLFEEGLLHHKDTLLTLPVALDCCNGMIPVHFFAHFTGRQKPWMIDLKSVSSKNNDLNKWKTFLNQLNITGVNSDTIGDMKLGSRLGFFNANFPKGGFKTKKNNN
eukprot:gene14482-19440_t